MKRILLLATMAIFAAFTLISCTSNDVDEGNGDISQNVDDTAQNVQSENEKEVAELYYNTINIIEDGELKYSAQYENTAEITAFELLCKICDDQNIEYGHLDGYVNSIDGLDNAADRGWLYYFNGEMPDVGAADYTIVKGFDNTVEFKYMKYSEAFGE